ncbi:leucine-rich repeat domain-containing protein [Aeoliella sp.]|uniref:leucine-rich repeat domain-containing protein n=1 Tax=Aeoliella sp. TaxID=2795800 RepID=UPI003CCB8B6B
MTPDRPTRWFRRLARFRLRTLLAVMLVVSLACGYLGKHVWRKRIERPIVERVIAAGGEACYEHQLSGSHPLPLGFWKEPPGPKLLRHLLGDDFFASVRYVELKSPWASDKDVAAIVPLPALEQVCLYGDTFTDECVADLLAIPQLRSLTLAGTSQSPSALAQLAELPQLVQLELFNRRLSVEHVEKLAQFGQLEGLTLHGPGSAPAESYTVLAALKKLRVLELSDIEVAENVTQQIGDLHSLTDLTLANARITDRGVKHLGTLNKLRALDLTKSPLTDVAVESILQLVDLEVLCIAQTQVTDEGLKKIAQLEKLRCLDISLGNGITLDGARKFQRLCPDCEMQCTEWYPDGTGAEIDLETGLQKTF